MQVPGVPTCLDHTSALKKEKVEKGGEKQKLIPAARIWERIPDRAGHVSSALQLASFSYLYVKKNNIFESRSRGSCQGKLDILEGKLFLHLQNLWVSVTSKCKPNVTQGGGGGESGRKNGRMR